MRTTRTLALCVAFAAALAGPARASNILDTVDAVAAQAVATAEAIQLPWDAVPNPPLPIQRTFAHNTDYVIISDYGSGPTVSKAGAFGNPNWWNCTTSNAAGAPVTVRCVAVPAQQSGIVWKCDVMDVTAKALTNHRHVHNWADRWLETAVSDAQATVARIIGSDASRSAPVPPPPDPSTIHWGQAAGLLGCDDAILETDTATQAAPYQTAAGTFGITGVTEFVCEARRALGDASAPITPYSVNCLDPGAPGVE